jgi:hypothetical protein
MVLSSPSCNCYDMTGAITGYSSQPLPPPPTRLFSLPCYVHWSLLNLHHRYQLQFAFNGLVRVLALQCLATSTNMCHFILMPPIVDVLPALIACSAWRMLQLAMSRCHSCARVAASRTACTAAKSGISYPSVSDSCRHHPRHHLLLHHHLLLRYSHQVALAADSLGRWCSFVPLRAHVVWLAMAAAMVAWS